MFLLLSVTHLCHMCFPSLMPLYGQTMLIRPVRAESWEKGQSERERERKEEERKYKLVCIIVSVRDTETYSHEVRSYHCWAYSLFFFSTLICILCRGVNFIITHAVYTLHYVRMQNTCGGWETCKDQMCLMLQQNQSYVTDKTKLTVTRLFLRSVPERDLILKYRKYHIINSCCNLKIKG